MRAESGSTSKPKVCKHCGDEITRSAPLSPRTCIGCYRARHPKEKVTRTVPAYTMTRAVSEAPVKAAPAIASRPRRGLPQTKSAAEKRWMERVAALPCVVCSALPVELHHIREGQGGGQRAQHTLVLPLCPEHHRGASGVHGLGKRGFYAQYRHDELDLLAKTIEQLA
jgi:hypothetical protein